MLKDLQVKRILFATDFLESSRLALDYAIAIAHFFKATLVMLNVIELSQAGMEAQLETRSPCMTRLDAQKRLEALAATISTSQVPAEIHVQNGVPWECISASVPSTAQTCWFWVSTVFIADSGICSSAQIPRGYLCPLPAPP